MSVIKLLRSNVPNRPPVSTDLEIGQSAINTAMQKMWMKDPAGNIVQIGVGPSDLANVAFTGDYNDLSNKPSITGGLNYVSPWNASTNTPTIPAASSGNKNDYYVVAVAGNTNIDGQNVWNVGDQLISNGTKWDRIPLSQPIDPTANIGASVTNGFMDPIEYIFTRQCTFALSFGDSQAKITLASGVTGAVGIYKNGVGVGGIILSGGDLTISSISTGTTIFNAGDVLRLNPETPNIAAFSFNLTGQWTLT